MSVYSHLRAQIRYGAGCSQTHHKVKQLCSLPILSLPFENINRDRCKERGKDWQWLRETQTKGVGTRCGTASRESTVWPQAVASHWAGWVEDKGRVAAVLGGERNALLNKILTAVLVLTSSPHSCMTSSSPIHYNSCALLAEYNFFPKNDRQQKNNIWKY